jgi:Icc-related predicted phosphoesterase
VLSIVDFALQFLIARHCFRLVATRCGHSNTETVVVRSPMVRLLLVADLHYALPQFDWVVAQAPAFDVVVLAGDHLDVASSVPLEAQSVVILKYLTMLHEIGPVAVSSGNHDLTGPDADGEQAALWLAEAAAAGIPTDGDSLMVGDALVTICPWWDGPAGRAALERQLTADFAIRPERWIWVYHWPPFGSPTCWTGRRHYGDVDLPEWIGAYRPDVVLTGHVHEPPFKPDGAWADRIGDTWVFNAGRQIGPIPAHVVVDTDAGTARWWSLIGEETCDLRSLVAPARTVF